MAAADTRNIRFLSWNIRSINKRLNDLIAHVTSNNIDIIAIQEPYTSNMINKTPPKIRGYVSYTNSNATGLLTYIRSDLPHTLVSTSHNVHTQYHHFHVQTAAGHFSFLNVYARSQKLNVTLLPDLDNHGTIYMGDFNARHITLGDSTNNDNGCKFIKYVYDNRLTVYTTDTQTHLLGGRLDYVMGRNLVQDNMECSLVNHLVSDHYAVSASYEVQCDVPNRHQRRKMNIPYGLHNHFINCISKWYQDYTITNVQAFSRDLVDTITTYYETWVCWGTSRKPRRGGQHPPPPKWVLDPVFVKEHERVKQLGDTYKRTRSQEDLHAFLVANREVRDMSNVIRNKHWEEFLQSINEQTTLVEVWEKIRKISRSNPTKPLHHSPLEQANILLDQWALTSSYNSLPINIQNKLNDTRPNRQRTINLACTAIDVSDLNDVTEWELNHALKMGKSTAPGEDGITYSLLRLVSQVPGNPLLVLYRMSLSEGVLPDAWTKSVIVPIPKPHSDNYRPISLTSCVCKVLERIVLNRLMYRIQGHLSPQLFGFMPGLSTQHCFAEYFAHIEASPQAVFIDLAAAFDTANREIILEQLAELGIQGKLLKWIKGYLSNRTAYVLFNGVKSTESKHFELGTPQGGVLSPLLFNVLMHKLIKDLPTNNEDTVICYADDICLQAASEPRMQVLLDAFATRAEECGLLISVQKTRALIPCGIPPPNYHIDGRALENCESYRYLGVPINDPGYLSSLKRRLWERLKPLRVLVGVNHGINVRLARMFYVSFIRSVIDYNALHLTLYTDKELKSLETLQNEAMRLILGAPKSTRIVNMRAELKLPTISERILSISTVFGVKALSRSRQHMKFQAKLSNMLHSPEVYRRKAKSDYAFWFYKVANSIKILNMYPTQLMINQPINPWDNWDLSVDFVIAPKKDSVHATLLKQLTLCSITESTQVMGNDVYQCYTDGSVEEGGRCSGCACNIFKQSSLVHTAIKRVNDWASTTQTELAGIYLATEFLKDKGSGLIYCDSQSALLALNAHSSNTQKIVSDIRMNVLAAKENRFEIKFLWIPSHVGISKHDTVDMLAKTACRKPVVEIDMGVSLAVTKRILKLISNENLTDLTNSQRPESCSIKHYDKYREETFIYGTNRARTRQCDVIVARIRLGYRRIWQLSQSPNVEYTMCQLCERENMHSLEHYIVECPILTDFRPPGLRYAELCKYYMNTGTLDDILDLYPRLTM